MEVPGIGTGTARRLRGAERIIICGSGAGKSTLGKAAEAMFSCAVLVSLPKSIRMERVKNRSYQKFGSRMLPGVRFRSGHMGGWNRNGLEESGKN